MAHYHARCGALRSVEHPTIDQRHCYSLSIDFKIDIASSLFFESLRHTLSVCVSDISDMPSIPSLLFAWVSALGVKYTPRRLEFPKQNTLAGLPPELLLWIADFLPCNDRTCLALCNHQFLAIYRIWYKYVPPSRNEKLLFLMCLERDIPTFFTCHVCHVLHKYRPSKDYGRTRNSWSSPLPCASQWDYNKSLIMETEDVIGKPSPYGLYFYHVQLAMKRFLYGPQCGISTEALSYTCVCLDPEEPVEKPVLSSSDAQICGSPPRLIVRIQRMIYVPAKRRYLLYENNKKWYSRWPWPMRFYRMHSSICGHLRNDNVATLGNNIVKAHRDKNEAHFSIHACSRCHTDFRIELCQHESDLALVVTKWIDLGSGLTPDSREWALHSQEETLSYSKATQIDYYRDSTLRANPRRNSENSARVLFETTSPLSLAALRSRNLSYLKNQRYRETMRQKLQGRFWESGAAG